MIATRFEVREARRLGRVAPLAWLGGMLSAVVLNPLKKRVKYNTVKIFSGYNLIGERSVRPITLRSLHRCESLQEGLPSVAYLRFLPPCSST